MDWKEIWIFNWIGAEWRRYGSKLQLCQKKSLPSKNYFSLSSILSFVLCSYRYQPFENHEWLIIEQAAAIYLSRDLTFCVFYHQYIQGPGIQIFLQNKTQNNSERFFIKIISKTFASLLLWPFLLSGLGSQVAFLDMGSGPSRQKKKQSKIINVSWVERKQRGRWIVMEGVSGQNGGSHG